MGLAMEVINGFATNPGATFTAVTNSTGDSTAVRSHPESAPAYLLDAWGLGATAGQLRVRSPRMHDNVNGITVNVPAASPQSLFSEWVRQLLYSQDTLTVERTGGGGEVDTTAILAYYTDLPGTSARLHRWPEISQRIRHILSVPVSVTSSATDGQYSSSVAINATADQFKANQDYALLGYLNPGSFSSVGVRGPDFGNLRVGGPGSTSPIETRDWFIRISEDNGLPCIPVFNAANKASTLVDVTDVGGAATVTVTFFMALLNT